MVNPRQWLIFLVRVPSLLNKENNKSCSSAVLRDVASVDVVLLVDSSGNGNVTKTKAA